MFSVSFPDGLLLLEVEAYDGLIRLLEGLLLLDACGGMTVSRRPQRRLREGMTPSRRLTPSRRCFGSTATERPRRGPNGLKIAQESTHVMLR